MDAIKALRGLRSQRTYYLDDQYLGQNLGQDLGQDLGPDLGQDLGQDRVFAVNFEVTFTPQE